MNPARVHVGFTLIEMVVLIVVLFGSVTSILSVSIEAAKRVGENNDSVIALQLAQEEAERLIALRRSGYGNVPTASYGPTSIPGYSAYARTVTITVLACLPAQPYLGLMAGCEIADIKVGKGSGNPTLATVKLLLANY